MKMRLKGPLGWAERVAHPRSGALIGRTQSGRP
jgi:hypothetical protein